MATMRLKLLTNLINRQSKTKVSLIQMVNLTEPIERSGPLIQVDNF